MTPCGWAADSGATVVAVTSRRRSAWVLVACTAIAFMITTGLLLVLNRHGGTSSTEETEQVAESSDPGVIDSFINAYRRSLEATYAIDGEFTRTMPDGRELRSGVLVAQRPPDHIRRQLGAVSGAIGDREINCTTDQDGEYSCAHGAAATPYPQEVERRASVMRSYFDPSTPAIYGVSVDDGGCYELELVRAYPAPSYGVFARMCFDDASGAMSTMEMRREDGSLDVVSATTIRQPNDLDFDLSPNAAFVARSS